MKSPHVSYVMPSLHLFEAKAKAKLRTSKTGTERPGSRSERSERPGSRERPSSREHEAHGMAVVENG
jgi:hypothetical protein